MKKLGVFLLGPVIIIAVLKIVSGDQHIHVAAPVACLIAWFIISSVLHCIDEDSKGKGR